MRLGVMFLDKANGISHCTYHLVEVLCREVEVICYLAEQNTMVSEFERLPCRVRAFAMKRGYASLLAAMLTGREQSGIAEAILEDSPDVILDTGSWWWRGVVERQLRRRIPTAEMVHDVTPHPGLMGTLESVHHVLYPSVADAVISLSEHAHREIVRKYPAKTHIRSRLGTLLPGAAVDHSAVASRRHRLLHFGRIEPYKGIDLLVDAFGIAKGRSPDLKLSIVGQGKIDADVLRRIAELGIDLRNEYVSDDEVSRIVAEHGVMVLPYTSATQSGVAAVAWANGLPCIATRVGALPEQVRHGINGIIVEPGDPAALAEAMVELSGDERMARRMSEAATALGREEFDWNMIARELLADLQALHAARVG